MKGITILWMSILMLVLTGCSLDESNENEPILIIDPIEFLGPPITVTDLIGTMRFDTQFKTWYIYYFHPGSIDAEDAYIPCGNSKFPLEIDKRFQQDGLKVIFSGTAFKIKLYREIQLGGWEDYAILIDHIEEYNSEAEK